MIHEWRERPRVKTALGMGYILATNFGNEDNVHTVALDNGAIVDIIQSKLRMCRNYTLKRGISDEEMRSIVEPEQSK